MERSGRGSEGAPGFERNYELEEHDPEAEKILFRGRTYDDVLLIPWESEYRPSQVSVRTRLTRGLTIPAPLVSAAMDTVTESAMAIALSRQGGIGVIHKNFPTIEQQAVEVELVKRAESLLIEKPFSATPDETVEAVRQRMTDWNVSGILIQNGDRELLGLVTETDLLAAEHDGQPVVHLMTERKELVVGNPDTTADEAERILRTSRKKKLPLVDEDNRVRGLYTRTDLINRSKGEFPNAAKERGRLLAAAAIGPDDIQLERAGALVDAEVDVLVFDTSNGHARHVQEMTRRIKENFRDVELIVGNVCTATGARALVDAGADAIKVGVGPGSICTTRVVAGVGMPQYSAVVRAAAEAAKDGVPVMADGGIRHYGDVAKALGGGAETVMIGSKFAAVEESPGRTIQFENEIWKEVRGMGSEAAMAAGSADRYGHDIETELNKLVAEGVEGKVPYQGKLDKIAYQMLGSLKGSMAYLGVGSIPEMVREARFVETTTAGQRESHPSVQLTKQPQNYSPS